MRITLVSGNKGVSLLDPHPLIHNPYGDFGFWGLGKLGQAVDRCRRAGLDVITDKTV